MDGFTESDRERNLGIMRAIEGLSASLEADRGTRLRIARRQLRATRSVAPRVASMLVEKVGRRALLLIGAGIALGSALGGAGVELARKAVAILIGAH